MSLLPSSLLFVDGVPFSLVVRPFPQPNVSHTARPVQANSTLDKWKTDDRHPIKCWRQRRRWRRRWQCSRMCGRHGTISFLPIQCDDVRCSYAPVLFLTGQRSLLLVYASLSPALDVRPLVTDGLPSRSSSA